MFHTGRKGAVTLSEEELALGQMLRSARLAGDYDLPSLFGEYAVALGVAPVLVYLADLQQRVLIPFSGARGPARDGPYGRRRRPIRRSSTG